MLSGKGVNAKQIISFVNWQIRVKIPCCQELLEVPVAKFLAVKFNSPNNQKEVLRSAGILGGMYSLSDRSGSRETHF